MTTKAAKRAWGIGTAWSVSALLLGACSGEFASSPGGEAGNAGAMGSSGTGGASTGGASASSGGKTAANSTGGVATTGGSPSGGNTTGGTGTGGKGTGGVAPVTGGQPSTGGTPGTGGKSVMTTGGKSMMTTGGMSGTGGMSATGGSPATGGTSGNDDCAEWPASTGTQSVSSTIQVNGTYDGELKRFSGSGPLGTSGDGEGQGALFDIQNGGTLRNVIIGSPAADGIHCEGTCTLENVWWEDVGEDAATFRGSGTVRCGGAKSATDKIFQHNGSGTVTIENFTAENFSKLYRSCGNCSTQTARHVVLRNVTARMGSTLVGINTNYGDSATFENITIFGNITICDKYTGNNNGGEPVKTGSGPDSQYCLYEASDITQM